MKYDKSINKIFLASLLCTGFVSYPNLLFLSWDWNFVPKESRGCYLDITLIRFLLFWIFSTCMLFFNQRWLKSEQLKGRILPNVVLTLVAFAIYKVWHCITPVVRSQAEAKVYEWFGDVDQSDLIL